MLLNWLTLLLLALPGAGLTSPGADADLQCVVATSSVAGCADTPVVAFAVADCDTPCDTPVVYGGPFMIMSDEMPAAPFFMWSDVQGDESPTAFEWVANDEDPPAKLWIGVRLTPVPAPLAAHIGKHGALVANVVKESPADKAGLEQYDVVVALDGKEIGTPEDLINAVAKSEAGKALRLTLIRQAEKTKVELTPRERPKELGLEMKYKEPDETVVSSAVKGRAKILERGPDGNWTFKDVGPMPGFMGDMNGALNKLHEHLENIPEGLRDLDVRVLRKLQGGHPDAEKGAQVQVRVKVEKDGNTTIVETAGDGKIHVTHKTADGKETTAVYDNADELQKADESAFDLFAEHSAGGGGEVIRVRPMPGHDPLNQQQFQVNVEKRVREALERAREAQEKARRSYRRSLDAANEGAGEPRTRVEVHKFSNQQSDESPAERPGAKAGIGARAKVEAGKTDSGKADSGKMSWSVRITDQGTIRVTVRQGGERRVSEFRNKDEFRQGEPDVYEKAKGMFE